MAGYEVEGPTGLRTQAIDCPVGRERSVLSRTRAAAPAAGDTPTATSPRSAAAPRCTTTARSGPRRSGQLRRRLIAAYGPAIGITRARTLVTNALEARRRPTRRSSTCATRSCSPTRRPASTACDRTLIWDVFAQRGMGYAASTRRHRRRAPAPGLQPARPAPAAATGSVSGTVRDLNTGAPLPGALVAFAGHDSGLGEDLSTRTTANGTYRIDGVPARDVGASSPWPPPAATTACAAPAW